MFSAEADLCALFKNQRMIRQIMITQEFGLPTSCPVKTVRIITNSNVYIFQLTCLLQAIICDRKPIIIDIKPFKKFLLLGLGTIRYKGVMINDNVTSVDLI